MKASELFDLKGKVALITGCSRGLGKDISLSLAQNGASLVLSDLVYPKETSEEISKITSEYIVLKADVSNEQSVLNLTREAISRFKRVDILINNAGIAQAGFIPTEDAPIEEWDKVMAVNLRGVFLCSKHVGKEMIKNRKGSIINIASTAGFTGVPRSPAYCSSKAGVILLTKSLALEWARYNIRVNAIAPHYLKTDLTSALESSKNVYDSLIKQIPMRRFGLTSELIGLILLLASDASTYMTGTVAISDGGYLAQ
ncbi:MAG TPA: 3-oxoacyl-ACP reductase family protein [Desulfobacteraceae bacterium]|nr:3-oxoacyl-ACP reductase family protein [Desulfobacteraceae bacterium]HPJ66812.1 3-oxoacyl-ACP reductase family protein [Desulfobacteraceae bacterium]HPQ27022.1 3-oxoacyl-ACP reductase family protein [Desulfobacteraceae bacterium]